MKKINIKLREKLLLLSLLPILLVGVAIIVICYVEVSSTIENETKNSLKATAESVLASYNQNTGDYFVNTNGDIWKGSYDVSKSESLVESISKGTNMQVTFFYGPKRIVTSIEDEDGNKILDSAMGDKIQEVVLKNGEDYFTDKVLVYNTQYYGYYIPVHQNESDEVVGAIFVGTECSRISAKISNVVLLIAIIIIICLIVTLVCVYATANKIVKALKMSMISVSKISTGDLTYQMHQKSINRNDEIGELARNTESLRGGLGTIVDGLIRDAKTLDESSEKFTDVITDTVKEIDNIKDTVENITESAKQQSEIAQNAVIAINVMDQMITDTTQKANGLTVTARQMRDSSNEVSETLKNLQDVNTEVISAVNNIYNDTQITNQAANEIQSVVDVMAGIADETNLLALNASIEASRAGEAGRGFAVVATEIQKLAEQSNISSSKIADIVSKLYSNSSKSVETMNKVQTIINKQSEDVINTSKEFKTVETGIEEAINGISKISEDTNKLNKAKAEFVDQISTLSAIAQENEANTSVALGATDNVVVISEEMKKASAELKNVSDNLLNDVKSFVR